MNYTPCKSDIDARRPGRDAGGMTTANVSTLRTKAAEAADALESGDWSTALSKLLSCQTLLAAIPDSEAEGFKQSFGRDVLPGLIAEAKAQQAAAVGAGSGGVQSLPVVFERGAC